MNYFDRKCSNSEFIHNLTSDVRENLRPSLTRSILYQKRLSFMDLMKKKKKHQQYCVHLSFQILVMNACHPLIVKKCSDISRK